MLRAPGAPVTRRAPGLAGAGTLVYVRSMTRAVAPRPPISALLAAAALAGCCKDAAPALTTAGPPRTDDGVAGAGCPAGQVAAARRLLGTTDAGDVTVGSCERVAGSPRWAVLAWQPGAPDGARLRQVVLVDPGDRPPDSATIVARAEPVVDGSPHKQLALAPPVDIDGDGAPELVARASYDDGGLRDETLVVWRVAGDRLEQVGGASVVLGFAGYGRDDCVADVAIQGDGVIAITRHEVAGRAPHLDVPAPGPCAPGPDRYRLAGDAITLER